MAVDPIEAVWTVPIQAWLRETREADVHQLPYLESILQFLKGLRAYRHQVGLSPTRFRVVCSAIDVVEARVQELFQEYLESLLVST